MLIFQKTKPVWWYMPIISALRRLSEEKHKFNVALATKQDPISKKERKKLSEPL
jgi:hypothetical protein